MTELSTKRARTRADDVRRGAARPRSDYEYVEGWGMAHGGWNRVLQPRSVEEIAACFELARRAGTSLSLRGAGFSYGDASTSAAGHVLDFRRMRRVLAWDPESGVAELEPGVTIEELWKRILPDGWWPKVVPGTMFPTAGGVSAMNIHGKNNFAVGTWGDNTLELDLVLPSGEVRTCNREREPDLFHAAIGGLGMLGAFSRLKVQTKKVHSGELDVLGVSTRTLREMMVYFEEHAHEADYLVGWIDCFARDENLGRGLIHHGRYLQPGEDPDPGSTLRVAHQELPTAILGVVPKAQVWRMLRLFNNDLGMRLVNAAKYQAGRLEGMKGWYRQPHAAFNFLLDSVPNWKWAYGRHERRGLIQYQVFLPHAAAHDTLCEILRRCQEVGLVSYLGVLKRHRPDPFWLTHALDGWSLALDFKVTPVGRERLWSLCHELTERVLAVGGKFYFAKDLVLRSDETERFLPPDRLAAFRALKREVDPENLLQTDLSRRLLGLERAGGE